MLAKLFRFHGHNAVRAAYRHGRAVRGNLGSLHVYRDIKHPRLKVAVVVSKKVSKSAVVRNRIRRRVYEIVRTLQPGIKQPAELVFTIYQAEVAAMPSAQLAAELRGMCEKAGLI